VARSRCHHFSHLYASIHSGVVDCTRASENSDAALGCVCVCVCVCERERESERERGRDRESVSERARECVYERQSERWRETETRIAI
jgi:hypothetical protein